MVHVSLNGVSEINQQVRRLAIDSTGSVETDGCDHGDSTALDKVLVGGELIVTFTCLDQISMKAHLVANFLNLFLGFVKSKLS